MNAPGMLNLVEDHEFYYDPQAAVRPIRFIEKFLRFDGGSKPFLLEPIQRQIIGDLYGWKRKDDGLRRFTHVWWEGPIGCGKSPVLAALGLYAIGWDNEFGAQVYSLAATYSQARIVFEMARDFVQANPELEDRLEVLDKEIRHRRTKSFWRIKAGRGKTAGLKPSMILADEIHEWKSRETYDALESRSSKRTQSLTICATNAGQSQQSLCWQMHEKAEAVLHGRSDVKTLYPIIWKAEKDAEPADPAAWQAANPLLNITILEKKVLAKWLEAKGDPSEEAKFRRLYLTQWVQGATKWLDIAAWDGCTRRFDEAELTDFPLYVGLDLSMGDDLCAVAYVWASPDAFYVDARFVLPRATAEHYETREAIPYLQWAESGAIELIDDVTISPAVKLRIADAIRQRTTGHQLQAVCYDRYKADDCIAALEGAGITCIPTPQGYTLSPGCEELARRLKEQSIVIAPNPVLRANAEIVELETKGGNVWPRKPNAKGQYQGRRGAKIDGITALVTAMTEARKHSFPDSQKIWKGDVLFATRK